MIIETVKLYTLNETEIKYGNPRNKSTHMYILKNDTTIKLKTYLVTESLFPSPGPGPEIAEDDPNSSTDT